MPDARSAPAAEAPQRDKPWLFRTYAGHSSAEASNRLYRDNLARGQTGLSVAFDLPTQTGYDPDHVLSAGEVGKVGVPVAHLGDMQTLFRDIPLERMNTSMTINATAPWLLALYVATAEAQGADAGKLAGTTQNDVLKEYLSRGTYVFPPGPSLKLTGDLIAYTAREIPRWNPINISSYHLQEAGADPVQEVAYALANAVAVLDALRACGEIEEAELPKIVGRISFFVNAGLRFLTEICKLRAFGDLWDEIAADRYGVEDPKLRRFRYGVQVNSLGLTEAQPENNIHRILIEMLGVTLSKHARARAVQLPAWNEAMGLPRPWDQQLSLRAQQILAHETDLLEFADIFDGAPAIEKKAAEIRDAVKAELDKILAMGGAVAAVEQGYMKRALARSLDLRRRRMETGDDVVVGLNSFRETASSPLEAGGAAPIQPADAAAEARAVESVQAWRQRRDEAAATNALAELSAAAAEGRNVMPASIAAARAGVTTGEWAAALREVYGEYRAPTGIETGDAVANVEAPAPALGRAPRLLVAKPGLDGHSNGAEQIALRARAAGFATRYDGIRQTPVAIAEQAAEFGPDVIGLSILSGSHMELVRATLAELRDRELGHVPVIVGGDIPAGAAARLKEAGVAAVYPPKDYAIDEILGDLARIAEEAARGRNVA
ncbi:MAG: methylmalonyl-CoA mutase family protein [Alphaproteobacteria bacterium]